jgi:hypothetical protein
VIRGLKNPQGYRGLQGHTERYFQAANSLRACALRSLRIPRRSSQASLSKRAPSTTRHSLRLLRYLRRTSSNMENTAAVVPSIRSTAAPQFYWVSPLGSPPLGPLGGGGSGGGWGRRPDREGEDGRDLGWAFATHWPGGRRPDGVVDRLEPEAPGVAAVVSRAQLAAFVLPRKSASLSMVRTSTRPRWGYRNDSSSIKSLATRSCTT